MKLIDDNILSDLSKIESYQIEAGNKLNSIVLTNIPTDEIIMKRKLFISNISQQIINLYSNISINCSIELFGSCALKNDIISSDIDLVVNSEKADAVKELEYICKRIRRYLYKNYTKYEVHFIRYAKHPIIKIEGDTNMDISYGSRDGVEFVNYIENYTTLPISLILHLSRIIKIWSKQRKLLPSNAKGMSNYCWLIILLFYSNQYSDLFWFVNSLHKKHYNYAVTQLLFIIFAKYIFLLFYYFYYFVISLTHVNWSIYAISQSVSAYRLNLDSYQFLNNRMEYTNPFLFEEDDEGEEKEYNNEENGKMEIEEKENEENEEEKDMVINLSSKISVENPRDRFVYYHILLSLLLL